MSNPSHKRAHLAAAVHAQVLSQSPRFLLLALVRPWFRPEMTYNDWTVSRTGNGSTCVYRYLKICDLQFGYLRLRRHFIAWTSQGMSDGSSENRSNPSAQVISIPESVRELPKACFSGWESLRSVRFGSSSKLERICAEAFVGTSLESVHSRQCYWAGE